MAIVHLGAKRVQGTKSDRVSDSLGSSADGTNTGITLVDINDYATFNGTSSIINLGNGLDSIVSGGFTFTCWAYFENATASQHRTIISKPAAGSWTSPYHSFTLQHASGGSNVELVVNDGSTYRAITVASGGAGWHFISVTKTSGNVFVLQVDNGTTATMTHSPTWGTQDWVIGNTPTQSRYWDGSIKQVLFYNDVLSSSELTTLYNSGSPIASPSTSNLVSRYNLETNANDSQGSNNGTATNVTFTDDNYKLGTGAYSLNGSSSKVVCGTASDFSFINDKSTDWSIAWWHKNTKGTVGNNEAIFATLDTGGSADGFYCDMRSSQGLRIGFQGSNGGAGGGATWSNVIPTDTSVWTHFVLVCDVSESKVALYKNGSLVSNESVSWSAGYDSDFPLCVGAKQTAHFGKFVGDDWGIWKRELTATEISDLVNETLGTADYTDDLTTNNFSTDSTSQVTYDSTNDELDVVSSGNNSTSGGVYDDLGITLSETAWVLRVHVKVTGWSANSGGNYRDWKFLLTDSGVSTPDSSGNSLGFGIANYSGGNQGFSGTYKLSSNNQRGWTGFSSMATPSTTGGDGDGNYYIEITRDGDTELKSQLYSDNTYSTKIGTTRTYTISSGTYSLSRIWIAGISETGSGTNNASIKDIKIYNDSPSPSGALVSSLSDKSNLKANYTMDSLSLGATASIDDDFSSDNFTNVGGQSGWGVSSNSMAWTTARGSTVQGEYIALPSTFSGNFVVRFKLTPTTVAYAGTEEYLWAGLTNSASCNSSTSQNQAGMYFHNYSTGDSKYQVTYATNTGLFSGASATSTNFSSTVYYIEISKSSDTVTLKLFSDSGYSTLVSSATSTAGGATDSYTHFILTGMYHGSSSGGGSSLGTIDDLKIYKDVSSLDGCKNDFSATSALDGQTNLPVNTIFEQTDDTPKYWWKQSDNTWALDGTTRQEPSLSNSAIWSMVGKQTGSTTTTLTGGKLRFDQATNHNTADSGAVAVFDTGGTTDKFVIRFNFTTGSSHTDGGGNAVIYWGLSSNDSYSSSQGFITGNSGNSADAVFFRWHIASNITRIGYYNGGTLSWGTNPNENLTFTDNTTYYFELSFDGSTTTLKRFTDSTYGTATHTGTQTSVSGVSGLRYFVLGNTVDTVMGVFTIDHNKFEIQKDGSTWIE